MINFSKVARQLNEMPDPPADPPRRIPHRTGDQGFNIEHKVVDHLMSKHNPTGQFKHIDADIGDQKTAAKTDFYEKRSHRGEPDVGYSVKSKGDNNEPMKVHQTSAGNPSGLFSKLKAAVDVKNNYGNQIGDSTAKQALVMAFGSHMGTLSEAAETQLFPNLTDDQRNMLRTKSKKGQYLTPKEMKETFGEHYDELMRHLERKKPEVFKAIVRQHSNPRNGNKPYVDHDPQAVSKLIQHRRNAGTAPGDTSGRIDIHDISDEDVFEQMKWFSDDNRFYMSDKETDDIDKRLLDLYPITEENSKWTMRPGDGQGPKEGDRSFKRGVREHGIPEPGQFKATMGTNPEWLNKHFPPEASYEMKDEGDKNPIFTKIQDLLDEPTPEPTAEPASSPETYADGTPKDDIPDVKFKDFMNKAGDGALKKRADDVIKHKKQMDQRREATPENDGVRFKVLDDGRILDTLVNKKFNPRSENNRNFAAALERQGSTELRDILKRIDASEGN